jgi:hypothetical protein
MEARVARPPGLHWTGVMPQYNEASSEVHRQKRPRRRRREIVWLLLVAVVVGRLKTVGRLFDLYKRDSARLGASAAIPKMKTVNKIDKYKLLNRRIDSTHIVISLERCSRLWKRHIIGFTEVERDRVVVGCAWHILGGLNED